MNSDCSASDKDMLGFEVLTAVVMNVVILWVTHGLYGAISQKMATFKYVLIDPKEHKIYCCHVGFSTS
jgi:hypothetical protein